MDSSLDKIVFVSKLLVDQRLIELRQENERLKAEIEDRTLNPKPFREEYSIDKFHMYIFQMSLECICSCCHPQYIYNYTPMNCRFIPYIEKIIGDCGIKFTSDEIPAEDSHLIRHGSDYKNVSEFGGLLNDANPNSIEERRKMLRFFKALEEVEKCNSEFEKFKQSNGIDIVDQLHRMIQTINNNFIECTCFNCNCMGPNHMPYKATVTFMPCHFDVWFYPIKKQCKIKIADKNAHFYYTKRTMDDGRPFAYLEYGELIGYNAKNRPEDLNAVLKFRNALQHFIDVSTATPPEPVEEGTPITTFNTHTP